MNQYAVRDIMGLDEEGGHYCKHVQAMTREGLHSKSDIAAELGYRDLVIYNMTVEIAKLKKLIQSCKDGNVCPPFKDADNCYCRYDEDTDTSESCGKCWDEFMESSNEKA